MSVSSMFSPQIYNLYYKGLVGENSLAGFGVAIFGQNNDLLFQMNGQISSFDITVLEAELTALKQGLTEARRLGIYHISIYCDYYPIYELIIGKSVDGNNKTLLLLRDVQFIRKQFASSYLYSVSEERIRYAYKLAREIIVSEVSLHVDPSPKAKPITRKDVVSGPGQCALQQVRGQVRVVTNFEFDDPPAARDYNTFTWLSLVTEISLDLKSPEISLDTKSLRFSGYQQKKSCSICLYDDINADQMFTVDGCYHKFCSDCVKRHIEARLLEGNIIRCPYYQCICELTFGNCDRILTPKLKEMWEQRIKEASIPFVDRVYCPNLRCSALLSKTKLSKDSKGVGVKRSCTECGEAFCINCKVLWHNNLSCRDYVRLHPNHTTNDGKLKALAKKKLWRQCGKCQHMIELSIGCVSVMCRCGHTFCYQCGAVDGGCSHGHALPQQLPQPPQPPAVAGDLIKSYLLTSCGLNLLIFAIYILRLAFRTD